MLFQSMLSQQSVCLRRLAGTRAREVQFGRWLANDKVSAAEIISTACRRTGAVAAGRHVLAIQDTTELNYQAHARRVRALGTAGNGGDVGMFLHPLLAVDAADGTCLGLAHVHHWCRTHKAAPDYRQHPIEDKESYRWLQGAQAGKECLSEAAMVTVVADRESDIYEEWARLPDERTHLLTRACRDRILASGGKLYAWIDAQPEQGSYCFDTPARAGKRTAHRAQMSVRFGAIAIKRPASCPDKKAPAQIQLHVVEVKELIHSVVGKEAPIHWRLLTTHPVACLEDALQCVDWYRQRWNIEQLFRTLKRQGLNVESSQVETGAGLAKLACLALQAAVRTMQLTLAREGGGAAPAGGVFDKEEVALLQQVLPSLEGKTHGEVAVALHERSGLVHADLSVGANVAAVLSIKANRSLTSRGVMLFGAGFIVTPEQATSLLPPPPLGEGWGGGQRRLIRHYSNGRDLTDKPRGALVIDAFGLSAEQLRDQYPSVYQWLQERVKPERDANRDPQIKANWWLHGRTRGEIRLALANLPRYIATVETAKHRTFQFLDASILPDNMLIAIAVNDAFTLGVLSSQLHIDWALATGSRLGVGNDPRYNKSRCFETFPFPDEDTGLTPPLRERIAQLAEQIDAHRKRVLGVDSSFPLWATLCTHLPWPISSRGRSPRNAAGRAAW